MHKLLSMLVGAVLVACAVVAEPMAYYLNANTGETRGGTFTTSRAGGYSGTIKDIYVTCTDNASVATVTVYRVAIDTNVADFALATATVTASKVFRPSFDRTDSAGTGLTSDQPDLYTLAQEQLKVVIENCTATGKTWKVTIKTE